MTNQDGNKKRKKLNNLEIPDDAIFYLYDPSTDSKTELKSGGKIEINFDIPEDTESVSLPELPEIKFECKLDVGDITKILYPQHWQSLLN